VLSLAMSSALALPVGRISSLSRRDLDQEFPRRELKHPLDARDTDDDLEARVFDLKKAFTGTLNSVKRTISTLSGKKPQQQPQQQPQHTGSVIDISHDHKASSVIDISHDHKASSVIDISHDHKASSVIGISHDHKASSVIDISHDHKAGSVHSTGSQSGSEHHPGPSRPERRYSTGSVSGSEHNAGPSSPKRRYSTGSQSGSEHHNNNEGSTRPERSQTNIYGRQGLLVDSKHTGGIDFRHSHNVDSDSASVHSGHTGSNNGGSVYHNVAKPGKTGVTSLLKKVSQFSLRRKP